MTLPIISAEQRQKERRGIKGVLLGKSGVGKTSQLYSLDEKTTLFIDLEAGDLAVQDWQGDTLRPKTWTECRDLAVFVGGANPALADDQAYSQAHYDAICEKFGSPNDLDKYQTIFIDSITVAGRLCFQWCKQHPQSFSDKTGKPDIRATYGLHGQEMIAFLTQLQHTRNKNIWFVGILDEKTDDYNRHFFEIQIEGAKTGHELPGIVDQVITMAEITPEEGEAYRAFITHTLNPWQYPAKDRSGKLDMMEPPDLGRLMRKINNPEINVLRPKFDDQA